MIAGVPESIETLKAVIDLIKSRLKDAEENHAAWSNRLDHWMQSYLHCIEREVVSSAVKMRYQPGTDHLTAEIQQEIWL